VCTTTYQPVNKSNPTGNPNPNPTTKQHARNSKHSTKYSHMSYLSREINMRRRYCTFLQLSVVTVALPKKSKVKLFYSAPES